jgi:hypothetical protein
LDVRFALIRFRFDRLSLKVNSDAGALVKMQIPDQRADGGKYEVCKGGRKGRFSVIAEIDKDASIFC